MITPEYLNQIVHATEERVSRLHEYLIAKIAEHIAQFFGKENVTLMASNIHELHQLIESGKVYEDIEAEMLKRYPQIAKEIKQAFLNSAAEISKANTEFEKDIVRAENLDVNVPDYDINGIPTAANELNLTDFEVRLLEADYRRTNGTVRNLTKTTASAGQNVYIEACDNAFMKIQHGSSPSAAITEAILEVATKGVGVVLYDSGRRMNIETAISNAVRTGINQANADIVLQRCAELGVSYVNVSEHMGARVTKANDYTNHSHWQGKAYKLDWDNPVLSKYSHEASGHVAEIAELIGELEHDYPDFIKECGYGQLLGICGINCRHTFSMFYPNIQPDPVSEIDKEENAKRYNEVQQQRAMGRAIRKTKREIAGLKVDYDNPESLRALDSKQNLLDKQLDAYREYCKEHRLNADGSRLVIPK